MVKVDLSRLGDVIEQELQTYANLTTEEVKGIVLETAKEIQNEIQSAAPNKSGKYSKSWAIKKIEESGHKLQVVIHSKNRYQLTHLLEFGHAKRGGGRTKAIPHIAAAESNGIKRFEEKLRRELNG